MSAAPSCPDEDALLMIRLRDGDDLALNSLMDRWQKPLLAYITRSVGDPTEALDLAQETFVRVYRSRQSFRPQARFSTWLYTIATHLCRNHLRWRSRHPKISLQTPVGLEGESTLGDVIPGTEQSPAEDLTRRELSTCVKEAVFSLPENLREALILFEYGEMSQAQVAEILGCSVKTVETRVYRARNILRKKLATQIESLT